MEPKLLLVKGITLLYQESLLNDPAVASAGLVKSVVATIKFPDYTMETDTGREALISLKSTLLWMCENPTGHPIDRGMLLQRIRINVGDDDALYQAIEQGLPAADTELESLKMSTMEYRRFLRSYLDHNEITAIMNAASQKVRFGRDAITDWTGLVRDLVGQLEPFKSGNRDTKRAGLVAELDVSDEVSLAEVFGSAILETSTEGVIKMGWQGMNRMLGDHGGLLRGECVVVGALQHNFKTGFTLSMFKHGCIYNTPYMLDKTGTKKPLNIHLSFENNMRANILWLFANLKEIETGVECDLNYFKHEDREEAARRWAEAGRYVREQLEKTGYNVKFYQLNPTELTYQDIYDLFTELEATGHEIHLCVADYLNMISKRGCADGPTGANIRDLWRRIRNFMGERKITFVSPHQLATDAKQLVRQGVENFVKEIANKGYYDGCRTLDQEVDLEIYIHIEIVNGRSYLTVQRGKHRKPKPTPLKDLYFVLPFQPIGALVDDLHGKDTSRRSVGGSDNEGEDGETPWWQAQAA